MTVAEAPERRGGRFLATAALVLVAALIPATADFSAPCIPDLTEAQHRVPIGLSTGFMITTESETDLRKDLDSAQRLGITRLRIDVSWAVLQPGPDQFDWSSTDRVLDQAHERGLHVLGIIGYEPGWARRRDASGDLLPPDPQQFASFVRAAAERYRTQVGAWEIWNEPNTRRFWGTDPDPAAYAAVVAAAAPEIRAADPGAPIIIGSLAPADDGAQELSPATFVRGIYDNTDLADFDALSVHPYTYPARPTGTEPWNTFFRLRALHRIMIRRGDGAALIWLTEYGAPSGTSPTSVTEAEQASLITAGIRVARRRSYTGPIYIYSLRDAGTERTDVEDNFGVLRFDGFPKPARRALAAKVATSCTVVAPR